MNALVTTRLADLARAAIYADERLHEGLAANISDEDYARRDDAALEAATALRDHLLNEHGLTTRDLRKLGGIL